MTTGLILEWRKEVPTGSIGVLQRKLDRRSRFVADEPSRPELRQPLFPTTPDRTGLLERLCESMMAMADGTAWALALPLGMMHCKNVAPAVVTPEPKQSRRHARQHGRPLTRYHVLDIRPMTLALERDGRARQGGLAASLLITATIDAAPDSWRRLVGQMLRAFATPDAPIPPLPDAPGSADLYRAMARTP